LANIGLSTNFAEDDQMAAINGGFGVQSTNNISQSQYTGSASDAAQSAAQTALGSSTPQFATITGSDGSFATESGNMISESNGTTGQVMGNFISYSNGTTGTVMGNEIVNSDGTTSFINQ
jgi:hypothetical protein